MAKRNELSLDQKVKVLEALETRNHLGGLKSLEYHSQQSHGSSLVKLTLSRDYKKCRTENGAVELCAMVGYIQQE
jgi:hypothetical protein